MNDRSRTKQEDTHFRLLRLLQDNPSMSQRELADAVGISLGTVNYCLRALLDKGLIKIRNFQKSDRKLSYSYLLTPSGLVRKAELTARFLNRKLAEYEQLKDEIEILTREVRQERPGTGPGEPTSAASPDLTR